MPNYTDPFSNSSFEYVDPFTEEQQDPKEGFWGETLDYVQDRAGDFAGYAGRALSKGAQFVGNNPALGNISPVAGLMQEPVSQDAAQYVEGKSQALIDHDFGFDAQNNEYSWEKVKENKDIGTLAGFITREGLGSAAEMLAMLSGAGLAAYGVSATERMAEERAKNNNKERATLEDYSIAAPTAVATVLLDKLGFEKALGAIKQGAFKKNILASAGAEAGTEALQEGIESTATTLGTEAGFDWEQTADQMLAGAVAGGGMGAAINTTAQITESLRGNPNSPENIRKKFESDIEQIKTVGREAEARGESPQVINSIKQRLDILNKEYDAFLQANDPGFVKGNVSKQEQAKAQVAEQGGDALDQANAASNVASSIANDVASENEVRLQREREAQFEIPAYQRKAQQQGLMSGALGDSLIERDQVRVNPMQTWQPNFTMPGSEQEQAQQVDGEYISNADFPDSVPLGNTLGFDESVGAIDAMPENRVGQSDTIFTGEQREELPAPQRLGLPDKYTNTIQGQDRTAELDAQEQMRQAQNAPRQIEQKDVIFAEDNRFRVGTDRATIRSNGNPFPTVKSVQASRSYRDAVESGITPEIVKIGNGFGWETNGDIEAPEVKAQAPMVEESVQEVEQEQSSQPPKSVDVNALNATAKKGLLSRIKYLKSEESLDSALQQAVAEGADSESIQEIQTAVDLRKAQLRGDNNPQPATTSLLDTGRVGQSERPTKAITPQGREVGVEYRVVDASQVINSNDENGVANPDFPQEYQNRNRSRSASTQQIRNIANKLNPEQVDYGNMSTDGAPIVSQEGIVESGNGRVAGIKLAYKQGKANAYREYLEQQGYDTEGLREPVLVRVRTTDMTPEERRQFVTESNERTTLSLSATEKAKDDANIISRIATDFMGGDVDNVANSGFVRKFMQGISSTEAAELTDADGRLSQTGKRRIEAALLYNAYGDERVVTDLFESSDNDIKSIGGALLDNAGQWAKMRQQAPTELDMTNNVIEAVNLVKQARREGRSVQEIVGQQDIFSGEIPLETERALKMMYGTDLKRAVSRKSLSEKLSEYATLASNVNPEPGLFGDEVGSVTSNDLMDQINGTESTTQDIQTGLFDVESDIEGSAQGGQSSGNDTLTEDNQSLREPEPQESATLEQPPEGGFFTPDESDVGTTQEVFTEEQVEIQQQNKPDLSKLSPVERYDALWDRANEGDASLTTEDLKGSYQALLQNEDDVKAELNGLTKKQLLKYYNGFHDSGMKKQELVDSAYDDMLKSYRFLGTTDDFVSSTMVFGAKGIERYDNVTRELDNLTDEKLREVITTRKAKSDERTAEMKARVDGMKNPETLEDFRNATRYGLNKNFTNEQWAKYDRLVADEQMERQKQQAERQVQAFDGEVNYNLHETTHSKKGHDLFVVEMVERLPSDKYKDLNQKAKALGGYYSSYRRDGAIPGFQFPSEEARSEFVQVMNGESVTKTKQSKDKTDSLLGLAERIEEKANDELNRDRKTNTAKRAGEAASAIESAENNLVRAKKLKALANAIKSGEAKYLNKVTAGTDQELLESLWNQIWYRARNNDEYTEDAGQGRWQRERKWKEGMTDEDKVRLAEYPLTNMYPGMVKRVAKEMIDTKGYTLAGKSLLKLAESAGGDTKQVNVLANKHHEKMMEFLRKNAETEYGREVAKDYMRIKRMGLNSLPTLRAAMLEYKAITDSVGEVNTNSAVKEKLKYEEIRGQYKDLDFFNSTDVVANEAMNYLELEEGMSVLEPSAGVGHLADAAAAVVGKENVTTNEFAFGLNEFLKEKGYIGTQGDFLALEPEPKHDRVLMNPPFSKDQEIKHIEHAYKFLKPGGRLVAVTSSMAGNRSNKTNVAFREWMDEVDAFEVPLPEGAFKDAINPTNVNTKIIVIDKPEDSTMFSLANNTNPTTTRNRASVSSTDANKVIDSIISSWTGGIKARRNEFVVASTYDDLPSDIKDAAKQQGAENNVWGVFHKGKTYVVLDKHNSTQELETTIFHETYGHHGMKKLFGDEITQKMNQLFVANGGISGLRRTAEKYGIDLNLYEKGTESAGMPKEVRNRVLMEELLAHMQQDNKPSVKRMAKEVVGYIRQKLRDLGFTKLANVSDSDLFYILKQSRNAVVKGSVNGGDTMFMTGNVSKEQLIAEGLNDPREIAYQESILETLKSSDNAFDIRKAEALERKLDLAKSTFSNEEQNDIASDDATKSFTLKPDGIIKDTGDYYSVSIKDNSSGVESRYRLNKNPDDGYYVAEEQDNGEWSYYNEYESLQEFADSIDDINEYLGQDRKNENFSGSTSGTPLFRTMDDATPQSFTAPVEKVWSKDWFKRKLQDKFAPIKDMQASIENFTGEELPEDQDTYRAEELFYGKTENDLNKMEQNHVKPLVDAMTQNNIESGELDQYLIAKHAKERNAHIASINPEMPDGGSGMTNAEADEILARYEQEGKLAGLSIAANEVYKITEKRRELLRDSGLEDEALIDVWDANYQFYVPLKGYANDSEGSTVARTGKGFDIRGRESMRAMGRRTIAESPTAHAIQDLSATIIRARKNEVGQTFLNMVESNPNADIWEVFTDENPDTERRIVNGEVKENQPIDMRSRKDDYFSVKVDGKSKYIKLKDKDKLLLTAMKNMGPEQLNMFTKPMSAVTRWLSMVNTSLNPEFTVTNFTRDIQTALFNALAEQDLTDGKVKDKAIAKDMVKGTGKAVKALWKHSAGRLDAEDPMYNYIEEFLADGAKTGYFDSKEVDKIGKEMSDLLDITNGTNKGKLLKAKNKIGNFIEGLNGGIENGLRLSAYIEARRAGVSRSKAASFAKNLTVNFNRKGEAGTLLNSLYMFFNAAVQGNVNFARAIATPKVDEITGKKSLNTAQKVAAGISASAFGWAMLMREFGGDDEDGVPYWDKVPKGVRERNLVILKPWAEGEYYKVPLPYGYNIFYNIGDAMEAAVQSDTRTKGDLAAELALSAYASFIPLGSPVGDNEAESAALVATPTLFKPIVEIATNKNFFGGQIYRENMPYGPELRDSQMSMRSTGEMYKGIARWMNDVMGDGMKYKVDGEAPLYDISPDTIEHIVEFGLGGLYRFGSRMLDTAGTVASGGEIDVTTTPFIRQVNGEIRPYEDISNFYDARQELKNIEAELKSRKGKARMEFMQEYRDKYRLRGLMSSIDKRMKLLRKQRDRIEIDDSLSFVEREERLQRIEDKMKSAVATFNQKWNETE